VEIDQLRSARAPRLPDELPVVPIVVLSVLVPEFMELLLPELVELLPEFMELLPEFVELLRLASLPAPSVPVVEPAEVDPVGLDEVPVPVALREVLPVVELVEPAFMPVLPFVPGPAPPAEVPPVPCAMATPPRARAAAATRVERVYLVAFI
jgi:hypothetical protein